MSTTGKWISHIHFFHQAKDKLLRETLDISLNNWVMLCSSSQPSEFVSVQREVLWWCWQGWHTSVSMTDCLCPVNYQVPHSLITLHSTQHWGQALLENVSYLQVAANVPWGWISYLESQMNASLHASWLHFWLDFTFPLYMGEGGVRWGSAFNRKKPSTEPGSEGRLPQPVGFEKRKGVDGERAWGETMTSDREKIMTIM